MCVLGDLVEDVVVRLRGPLRRGSDVEAVIERRPGGSAANVAAAVVGCGGRSRFACRLGDDPLGDALESQIIAAGVDAVVERGGSTGSILVLVDPDGERTMARDRGSTTDLGPVDAGFLAGASWLHLTLYSFERGAVRETASALARAAHGRALPLSLDLSSVAVLESIGRRDVTRLVAGLEPVVVFANEDEARWVGSLGVGLGEPAAMVVKRGPDEAMVWRAGRLARVAVPRPLQGVDSTGAGDWFAAGFILARCTGADLVEATVAGHLAAHDGLLAPRTLAARLAP